MKKKNQEHSILNGDARKIIKSLPSGIADTCITSTPYFNQRDYGTGFWVGGDSSCLHSRIKTEKELVKQCSEKSTLTGSLTRQIEHARAQATYKETCDKCGAYRIDEQIGLESTPEDFTRQIFEVLMETKRVLKPSGTLWLNLGDSYCSTATGTMSGKMHIKGASNEALESRGGIMRPQTPDFLKPKDLIGIPWRIAFSLQGFAVVPFYKFSEWANILQQARETQDWELVLFVENMLRNMDLMSMLSPYWHRCDIIWAKPNPMPESVTDRPTRAHEYIFLLTKNAGNPLYWVHRDKDGTQNKPKPDYRWVNNLTGNEEQTEPQKWKERIECPTCSGSGMVSLDYGSSHFVSSTCKQCNGHKTIKLWDRINLWSPRDYYYDAEAIKTESINPTDDRGSRGAKKRFPTKEINGIRNTGVYPKANKRSVWSVTTSAYNDNHFATFPESLIVDCIKAGSSEFGCCADCGSPYERDIKKDGVYIDSRMKSKRSVNLITETAGASSANGVFKTGEISVSKTVGWKKTCECSTKDIKPALVFDPFAGTGTTLVTAEALGRSSLGIELSSKNIELAQKRRVKSMGMFMSPSETETNV